MPDPRRLRILDALKAKGTAIDGTGDFLTDAGLHFFDGELPTLGPDDPEKALAMIVGEDQIDAMQVGKLWIALPVTFVALVRPDVDQPARDAELVLADVKRSVEADLTLGGLLTPGKNNPEGLMRGTTEANVRQSGSETVARGITYVANYAETLGNPEA